ncbi:MAG: HPP family protein [Sulfuricurvum sp.]|jgi:CBS-domain-containing membrane protein|uniref:HPP family protein n=1 Tax=Sulfuricurvum sp. TaxID=2025608 RepID=UPI0025CEE2A3|nr:HPP family protein [Sulfuricurvum sp.]MCK9372223.1 HPP family protein [Sulfuricurvum sp.]
MQRADKKKLLHFIESVIAGVGALIGLAFIGLIAEKANTLLIIAPFGATAVLLFSAPKSPFSHPWNIFGGYVISTTLGMFIVTYTQAGWLPVGIGLGLTIMLMHWGRVIHPPAGANFLIVTQGHLSFYLFEPLVLGLIALVIIAMSIERIKKKIGVYFE